MVRLKKETAPGATWQCLKEKFETHKEMPGPDTTWEHVPYQHTSKLVTNLPLLKSVQHRIGEKTNLSKPRQTGECFSPAKPVAWCPTSVRAASSPPPRPPYTTIRSKTVPQLGKQSPWSSMVHGPVLRGWQRIRVCKVTRLIPQPNRSICPSLTRTPTRGRGGESDFEAKRSTAGAGGGRVGHSHVHPLKEPLFWVRRGALLVFGRMSADLIKTQRRWNTEIQRNGLELGA